jgi:hypothetical protein
MLQYAAIRQITLIWLKGALRFSVSKGAWAKAVGNWLNRYKITAGVNRQLLSFCAQVVPPELFALNATNGAIGKLFLCRTIIDHMERKPAAQILENAKSLNCLASGPKPDLLTVSRQICPANSDSMSQEAHEVPPGCIVALAEAGSRESRFARTRS